MIEMRWAQRVGRNPKAGPHTRLEYRYINGQSLITSAQGYVTGMEPSWSEWREVPTVWLGRHAAAPSEQGEKK